MTDIGNSEVPTATHIETKRAPADKTEGKPILVLNPDHGNEPYILATALGREVSKKFAAAGMEQPILVLPLLYGDRQINILLEENPNDAQLIHYDEEYGKILHNIVFNAGNFSDHLAQVNQHYDEVDKLLNNRYRATAESFSTRSLATKERVELSPKNIIGTIDVGSRVSIKTPHRYFAFPMLLSELLQETMQHPELGFSESDMKKLTQRMLRTESAYSQVFVPWINPFSSEHADNLAEQPTVINKRSRVYTPAMKEDMPRTAGAIPEPGVYIMFSGTGSTVETNRALIQAAHNAGVEAYSPPWIDVEGTKKMTPDVLADENMIAVLGRSGWGTGWQAFNLGLPWLVAEYQKGDDPEIYFNNLTIEALRLGKVVDPSLNAQELLDLIKSVSPGLSVLRQRVKDKFGTLNGIDFIAESLFRDLITIK